MTRRYPRAKWPLPAVVNPAGSRCITIPVPDDDTHVACFLGALANLASATQWSDDPDHTAREVALVWRDIIDGLEWGCDVQTQLRMDTDCGTIQYSYDGGATWHDLTNIASCVSAGIQDALSDGIISAPSQQPAGGTIPLNECWTYNITLRANQPWHAPNLVREGYSIAVTSAEGAWSDNNTVLSNWFCPPGTAFALGICGSGVAALPGDPLQSSNHMRLIGYCNGIYMDMYNTSYTVPTGTQNTDFFLQCNDGSLTDNAGEIRLTVTICNYSEWCYTWDFTQAAGPFIGQYGNEQWVNGVGWQTQTSGNNQIGGPQYNGTFTDIVLTSITVVWNNTGQDAFNNQVVGRNLNGGGATNQLFPSQTTGDHTYTWSLGSGVLSDKCWVSLDCANLATRNTVKSITLRGKGINPFGVSNC